MKHISITNLSVFFFALINLCLAADNDDKQELIYLAGVDIVANKIGGDESPKKTIDIAPQANIKPQSKRIELTGYIDSSYVYLIIDIKNGRYVTGNIFKNGKPIYINGEYVKGVLYLYDNQGNQYKVISDDVGTK